MNRTYCNLNYQRREANRSRVCNCCGGNLVREQLPWPKPDDVYYRGAVCPTCDRL